MIANVQNVDDLSTDTPIDFLTRRRLFGSQMLWAHVTLGKGCNVATHRHDSEQIAYVISGKVTFRLGDPSDADYEERLVEAGQVVLLPGGFPHGVDALEDSVILDVLSPPGEMGVDNQSS
jgi:quercetin dioxygenase-like cupin family protein